MVIQHRPGSKHGNADALSRKPDHLNPCPSYLAGMRLEDLPCGGCHYCTRADQQWRHFTRDIDEAVSLTNPPSEVIAMIAMEGAKKREVPTDFNQGDMTVMSEAQEKSLPVSGNIFRGYRYQKLPLEPVQESPNAGYQDYSAMLGYVVRVNSSQLGLTDAHFDVATVNGKSDLCACSLQIAQNTTPEEPAWWGFTFEDLKTKQAIDTDLKTIIDWLGPGEVPDEGVVFLASPEANTTG